MPDSVLYGVIRILYENGVLILQHRQKKAPHRSGAPNLLLL
jgi:hypothetical protein